MAALHGKNSQRQIEHLGQETQISKSKPDCQAPLAALHKPRLTLDFQFSVLGISRARARVPQEKSGIVKGMGWGGGGGGSTEKRRAPAYLSMVTIHPSV